MASAESADIARWRQTGNEADRIDSPAVDIRMVRDQLVVDNFAVPAPDSDLEYRTSGMTVSILANEPDPQEPRPLCFLHPAPQFEQARIRIIGQGSPETGTPLAVAECGILANDRLPRSSRGYGDDQEAQRYNSNERTHPTSVGLL